MIICKFNISSITTQASWSNKDLYRKWNAYNYILMVQKWRWRKILQTINLSTKVGKYKAHTHNYIKKKRTTKQRTLTVTDVSVNYSQTQHSNQANMHGRGTANPFKWWTLYLKPWVMFPSKKGMPERFMSLQPADGVKPK